MDVKIVCAAITFSCIRYDRNYMQTRNKIVIEKYTFPYIRQEDAKTGYAVSTWSVKSIIKSINYLKFINDKSTHRVKCHESTLQLT